MKTKLLVGAILFACWTFSGTAQVTKTKEHKGVVKSKTKPAWWTAHSLTSDKHIYFPDYYVFYEPDKGYVYWNNGKWINSSSVPAYMGPVDLNTARIQVIDDMASRPELEFRTYSRTYPAQKVDITVP